MPRKPKKPKKRRDMEGSANRMITAAILALFVLIGYMLFVRPHSVKTPSGERPPATVDAGKKPDKGPGPRHGRSSGVKPAPAPVAYIAKVAIIIDDIGTDTGSLSELLRIDAPVTFAVMPHARDSALSAKMIRDAGRELMLHLPMQPKGENVTGLGPGALLAGMDRNTLVQTVRGDLDTVPGAAGVNNHMGSLLTEDKAAMDAVMGELKTDQMFFIDSMTSGGSVALASAKARGVPAASRSVFLDDSDDPGAISYQFTRLVKLSLKNGSAIAIGHPRPATIAVLRREIPGLRAQGIEVVSASRLAR